MLTDNTSCVCSSLINAILLPPLPLSDVPLLTTESQQPRKRDVFEKKLLYPKGDIVKSPLYLCFLRYVSKSKVNTYLCTEGVNAKVFVLC